jgi:hypothetical protein
MQSHLLTNTSSAQLLLEASQRGLQTTTFRIGQISGSSTNGAWAITDWVPILIKSSITLGCLPDYYGVSQTAIEFHIPCLSDSCADGILGSLRSHFPYYP